MITLGTLSQRKLLEIIAKISVLIKNQVYELEPKRMVGGWVGVWGTCLSLSARSQE